MEYYKSKLHNNTKLHHCPVVRMESLSKKFPDLKRSKFWGHLGHAKVQEFMVEKSYDSHFPYSEQDIEVSSNLNYFDKTFDHIKCPWLGHSRL